MKKFIIVAVVSVIAAIITILASARPNVKPLSIVDSIYQPVEIQTELILKLIEEREERERLAARKAAVMDPHLKKELDCLAINIYREAAVEPIEGRIAVGQVTMNRVESPNFPNTVCEVVYEKTRNRDTGRIVCQFSWYCDTIHRNRKINQFIYDQSYEIAKQVLIDGVRLPSLEEALFYHANYVNPRWRLERIEQIGLHIFYKPLTNREIILVKN
jgi:spore germination cell wall hydrolase CwlJ-like protein